MIASVKYEFALEQHYKESRSHFVLSQDAQYGELLIPKGSLISRYDAFDNGEPQLPLSLRGLQAVRFPHPVQVAGMWVTAMEPPRMELAWDQHVGPVMRFDPNEENGYGKWVHDTKHPTIACSRGDIVLFEIPSIHYDIAKEFGKPEPDGANARFRPSEWGVQECEKGQGPIKVSPAYTATKPKKLGFNLTEKLYSTSSEIKSAVLCIVGVINKESSKFKKQLVLWLQQREVYKLFSVELNILYDEKLLMYPYKILVI